MTANATQGWVLEAVDRYEAPLLRYARRLLDDCDLAADAVQHAFVKLCEESHDTLEGHVAPWLFRVCRNRAVDQLRHAGRERSLRDAAAAAAAGRARPAAARVGREADPARPPERAVLARHVAALLAGLPAPQRETIDLWCEGLSSKQIAEVTGRTEGHVRVLAHRGLTALRSHPQVQHLLAEHRSRSAAPPAAAPTRGGTT
ncbi:MAG: RNA polymerase sigma factor [Planctomycetaceae bacterium]